MTAFKIELKNPSIGEHPLIFVVFEHHDGHVVRQSKALPLDAAKTPSEAEVYLPHAVGVEVKPDVRSPVGVRRRGLHGSRLIAGTERRR
jgi:hypothetical protein